MNSHILVPENQIYPFASYSTIRPFVDAYAYRPAGAVVNIPRDTYHYAQTNGAVTYVSTRKFQNNITTLQPNKYFQAF